MRALQNITCDVEEIDASYVNEAMVSGLSSPEDVIASHILCRVASANAMYLGSHTAMSLTAMSALAGSPSEKRRTLQIFYQCSEVHRGLSNSKAAAKQATVIQLIQIVIGL